MLNLLIAVYSLTWIPDGVITNTAWLAATALALIAAADTIHLRHMKGLR